ncbi:metallophosphoesterase 1 [Rhopalosiphum maidis]|uniref:metallophosphoesterase 1 n=1 Tax=Rhopalosiphum maidis TaxID=43146 RepID=UPI000EFF79FA|nr:metallophosphoesterase 1 [Rhopalosiphum maidis]
MIKYFSLITLKKVTLYLLCIIGLVFFCEYGIFYVVLSQCNWPSDSNMTSEQPVKVMFLADTHLLGTRKGHWLDKMIREWEMGCAFQTAIKLHKPELIFILGDLFDEGLWSSERDFNSYVETFKYLFSVPSAIQLYTIVGNHDIGFHYSITPHLERRFNKVFNTSSVELISRRNVHFVSINSMAMEMDGCFLCHAAKLKLNIISKRLKCSQNENKCSKTMMLDGNYSKPILLQHFPLYRKNDMACNEPDSASLKEKEKLFREGWDCLRKDATEKLLKVVQPRLVFGGHTHHGCHIQHANEVHEYSISSFNWRNKYNPSYMLALFSMNNYSIETCHMPQEHTIVFIYFTSIMIFLYFKVLKFKQTSLINNNHHLFHRKKTND